MPEELERVKRARVERDRAEQELRAAVLEAIAAGASRSAIARELEVSRQAVCQMAARAAS